VEADVTELFHEAMASLASGVTVITTRQDDRAPCGLAATSVSSYSASPPSLLVSIDHDSRCHDALAACERFGVHILHSGEEHIARAFVARSEDKFAGLDWNWDGDVPELAGALAYLRCRRAESFSLYDHTIVVGDIEGGRIEHADPLLYARRRMDWLLHPHDG
jgi:flavin reductase (DIM6/NTAB) family NADH-FMN oxidoreductase RutF